MNGSLALYRGSWELSVQTGCTTIKVATADLSDQVTDGGKVHLDPGEPGMTERAKFEVSVRIERINRNVAISMVVSILTEQKLIITYV